MTKRLKWLLLIAGMELIATDMVDHWQPASPSMIRFYQRAYLVVRTTKQLTNAITRCNNNTTIYVKPGYYDFDDTWGVISSKTNISIIGHGSILKL